MADTIPQADTVQWMGLCPCGCGAFKAALIDENGNAIAMFGWDREGWIEFTAGVIVTIDGESNGREEAEGPVHNHTSH